MGRRRKELLEYKEWRNANANHIQRLYRGHRSRMGTRIKMIERERKNRKKNEAGTVINTIIRGFLARQQVKTRRQEHQLQLLNDARAWKEGWSDDAEAWFYLNRWVLRVLLVSPSKLRSRHINMRTTLVEWSRHVTRC